MSKDSLDIKNMADMLKQGATLTELACPACASPLFRVKSGNLWCAKCKKRVVVLKQGESAQRFSGENGLQGAEQTILSKIKGVEKKIRNEEEAEELLKLNEVLASLLENLEKIKRMQ